MHTANEHETGRGSGVVLPVLVVLLLLVGLLLGGGISYLLWAGDDETAGSGDDCERYRSLGIAVGPGMYGVVTQALEKVTPRCTRVEPTLRTGGDVALGVSTGGALPDLWIPESRFWTRPTFLGQRRVVRMVSGSLARTPVLLVGGPEGRKFGSWGEAEVSGLVSVPDPLSSTVGALAVVAPQAEAAVVGRSPARAREMVVPFAQKYGARRSRGLDTQVTPASIQPRSRRLLVSTERELVEARKDTPYLRDLTPDLGAPALDFPLAVPRTAPPGAVRTARNLARYLASDAGAALLRRQGFRGPTGEAPPDAASDVSRLLPTPPARSIATTVQSWQTLSVPSAILAVIDASGSMDFATGQGTRMDILADAAEIGLSFLPGHARVGLWIFSIDKGGPGQDWRVLEPQERLDKLRFGRTQRFALRARAQELPQLTDGGTGLYDTALAAYKQALRDYRPHYSNAVVLMTDGQNEDPGSIELGPLLAQLRELRDPQRPVRLIGIAISEDADLQALQRMAEVTGGSAYLAEQPEDILGVFAQAVLSR